MQLLLCKRFANLFVVPASAKDFASSHFIRGRKYSVGGQALLAENSPQPPRGTGGHLRHFIGLV